MAVKRLKAVMAVSLLASLLLAACADSAAPEDVIVAYLEALLDNDTDAAMQNVCPTWESGALRDVAAFYGVTGELRNVTCESAGSDGDDTLVTCIGTMQLNYNGELRDRSLAGRTYRIRRIDGDWKMCGYS